MRPPITSSQAGSLVQSQLLDQSFESTPSHSFAQQNSLSPNDNHGEIAVFETGACPGGHQRKF